MKMSKKRQRHSKGVAEDVEMLFSKVFPLDASERDETPFRLTDSDRMFVEIKSSILPEMSELKERLNDIKSKLNDKEPFKWRQHTKNLNRAGKIVKALKDSVKPELCTQAWAKFHEIVTSFPSLISTRSGSLKTVHLCEAPGAFITSLNHYIKSHCSSEIREWKWKATTLNPYCESHSLNSMIPTNEFVTRTYENWYFGVDNTGDLMKWENVSELTGHDVVNLVTADGSVDCLDVPGEQESHVAALHYCELVAGLALLADGGSFVLKMFTLFEHSSVCMMYLLVCCFSKVWVFKPATSKSGNSEVYVICVGYRGKSVLTDKHFDRLKSTYGENPFEKALFPLECIPQSFRSQMINCSAFFSQHQIEAIETNLAAFPRMTSSQWHRLNEAKNKAVSFYMNRCQIKILERKNFVVSDVFLSGSFVFPDYKLAPGSYNERQQKQSWHSKQGIDKTTRRNKRERVPVPWSLADLLARKLVERVSWLKNSAGSFSVGVSKAIEGSRIKKIQNSLFCNNRLLQESEEALSNATIVQSKYSDSDTSFPYFAFKNSKSKSGLSYEIVDWAAIDSACNLLSGGPLAYTSLYSKERSQFVEWKTGSSAKHVDYETGLRVNLAMGDVYLGSEVGTNSKPGDEELKGQDTFLSQVLLALKILHPGGSFVIRVADLLTRFSASLVFILYKTFEMVDVIKPTSSCPFTSDRYIVCKGFRRCDASVLEMLEGVCQKMTELSLTDRAIVEILPTPYLLQDEIFCSWLCDRNDDVENRRISAIIQMEKRFWASSSEDLP